MNEHVTKKEPLCSQKGLLCPVDDLFPEAYLRNVLRKKVTLPVYVGMIID